MPKIGIMGGTFNPIHNGHLSIAERACKQFGLDKILFITSGNPPHKKDSSIINAYLRHKMVSIATRNYEKFEAYDYEVKKETYSYTYETLKHIKKLYKNDELYFIIGADSLHDLPAWKKPRLIMEICTLLVYARDGYNMEKDLQELKKEYYCKVQFIQSEKIDISSSQLRQIFAEGRDSAGLLPKRVLEFIMRNKIYVPDEGSIKQRLRKRLNTDRYTHSSNVANTAVYLAKKYGADENKAYLAGILHDCAKCIPYDEMLKKCEDYDVALDEYEIHTPALIHAKLGEKIAYYEFGIKDEEILEAIKWHTLGCPGMGELAKIIYVADMTEQGRSFEGIGRLRRIASENLDEAVYECTKATINFNEAHERFIHPMAYNVLEWLENNKQNS